MYLLTFNCLNLILLFSKMDKNLLDSNFCVRLF